MLSMWSSNEMVNESNFFKKIIVKKILDEFIQCPQKITALLQLKIIVKKCCGFYVLNLISIMNITREKERK